MVRGKSSSSPQAKSIRFKLPRQRRLRGAVLDKVTGWSISPGTSSAAHRSDSAQKHPVALLNADTCQQWFLNSPHQSR